MRFQPSRQRTCHLAPEPAGYPDKAAVTPYSPPPGTDKIMRLYAETAMFENGRVLIPRRASWLADYINELTSFPGSKHDDQVDATTQALRHMRENSSLLAMWRRLGRP
jgi:phage terminase large subunit-like protein